MRGDWSSRILAIEDAACAAKAYVVFILNYETFGNNDLIISCLHSRVVGKFRTIDFASTDIIYLVLSP